MKPILSKKGIKVRGEQDFIKGGEAHKTTDGISSAKRPLFLKKEKSPAYTKASLLHACRALSVIIYSSLFSS